MRERRADYTTPVGASSRFRRLLRYLHRMADPAAYMFTEPLGVLTEREAWAWPHGVSRSVSALTEGIYADGEPHGLQPSGARGAGQPLPIGVPSVSAFSPSPLRTGVLPGIPENALNNPTRREH